MSSYTSAGTILSVCANAPATFNQAGYEALSWTEAGEVDNLGEFGRIYELLTRKPLASRGTIKRKGSYDEGGLPLQLAYDKNDAGQTILLTASTIDNPISCRIVTPDSTDFYFEAMVMSFKWSAPTSSSFFMCMVDLQITTSTGGVGIVRVA